MFMWERNGRSRESCKRVEAWWLKAEEKHYFLMGISDSSTLLTTLRDGARVAVLGGLASTVGISSVGALRCERMT